MLTASLADLSDRDLLCRYREARSDELFTAVMARHGRMVMRTCLRMLGNVEDAEDATQATFVVLARRLSSVNPPLGPWLHGVARRVAREAMRGRALRVRHFQDAALLRETTAVAADAALQEELDAALGCLPLPMREAVILRYLEGRSQNEAAQIAGCPRGTLARRTAEGIALLRAQLR